MGSRRVALALFPEDETRKKQVFISNIWKLAAKTSAHIDKLTNSRRPPKM